MQKARGFDGIDTNNIFWAIRRTCSKNHGARRRCPDKENRRIESMERMLKGDILGEIYGVTKSFNKLRKASVLLYPNGSGTQGV